MPRIPEARPGLVFQYEFLRLSDAAKGLERGKSRPACILLPLEEGERLAAPLAVDEHLNPLTTDYVAVDGDVLIILIQSDKPTGSQIGVRIDIPTKKLIGLPTDRESYAIVSEVNVDRWPNPGMKWIIGSRSELIYPGTVPGPMLSRISRAWLRARELSNYRALVRDF